MKNSATLFGRAQWSDVDPLRVRSGLAAWLGWLFDGLELHLYTLVATPLVIQLLQVASAADPAVKEKTSYIQAAFLVGWALGGTFFGRLGDVLGRSRTLALTVATYAICTGLCAFAQNWWELMAFRFLAALGIGGEWALGASLLTETWPKSWHPWLAAILQTGVNIGILFAASLVGLLTLLPHPPAERWVFLIGVVPAVIVFWIRRQVPEPQSWKQAESSTERKPSLRDLFRGEIASVTWRTSLVCALGLTVWWLFLFWYPQQLRHILTSAGVGSTASTQRISIAFFVVIAVSILGNFAAGWLAISIGYRRSIVFMFICLGAGMVGSFAVPRTFGELAWFWVPLTGFFSGVFGLFTMYLPPLFPTLLRTTGAGFCYNVGRLAAAAGSIIFGLYASVDDFRIALLMSSSLAFLAALAAWKLPEERQSERSAGAR